MEMEMHCTTNDVLLESLDQVEKLKLDVQIRLQFKFDNSYALCIFWGVHKLSKSRYIVYAISDVFMFFRLLNFTTFNTCREKNIVCVCYPNATEFYMQLFWYDCHYRSFE